MASTTELVEAVYRLIASSPTPIPITLMTHGVDETAAIIGAIVERCARGDIDKNIFGRGSGVEAERSSSSPAPAALLCHHRVRFEASWASTGEASTVLR
jgi:hypothetical protein